MHVTCLLNVSGRINVSVGHFVCACFVYIRMSQTLGMFVNVLCGECCELSASNKSEHTCSVIYEFLEYLSKVTCKSTSAV